MAATPSLLVLVVKVSLGCSLLHALGSLDPFHTELAVLPLDARTNLVRVQLFQRVSLQLGFGMLASNTLVFLVHQHIKRFHSQRNQNCVGGISALSTMDLLVQSMKAYVRHVRLLQQARDRNVVFVRSVVRCGFTVMLDGFTAVRSGLTAVLIFCCSCWSAIQCNSVNILIAILAVSRHSFSFLATPGLLFIKSLDGLLFPSTALNFTYSSGYLIRKVINTS